MQFRMSAKSNAKGNAPAGSGNAFIRAEISGCYDVRREVEAGFAVVRRISGVFAKMQKSRKAIDVDDVDLAD